MVVPRDMQVSLTIRHYAYNIMGIAYIAFILASPERPYIIREQAAAQGKVTFRIIKSYELGIARRHQRVFPENRRIHRITRPSQGHGYALNLPFRLLGVGSAQLL